MIYCFERIKFIKKLTVVSVVIVSSAIPVFAQAQTGDSLQEAATLPAIIHYALINQPAVKQAAIDQDITDLQIKNKLADWYPQLNLGYTYQRNFQLPVSVVGGSPIHSGVYNSSVVQVTGTQNIFNRDALLASRTKTDVKLVAEKETEDVKISLVANVSKNFYDLLATEQQRKVTDENIVMLSRSLKDSRARYDAGLADKTDYQRATIALNNAIASKKEIEESLNAKLANLKYLINYPAEKQLRLQYDSATLENEIHMDTLKKANYTNRVEYQRLQAQLRLQLANVAYNKWSYIPTVSANGAYNLSFLNNQFAKLYNTTYPNSYVALTLAFPIFQGGKRKNNIVIAEKQASQAQLSIVDFINQANSEYVTAMAQYKASMANYLALKENMELAADVYRIIDLQYKEGIKTYLELITAQTDLRSAQINYFNAVYSLLSSKIDVQKAEGAIQVK
ncbi:MAG: TolC family protein [Niabella sp.]